MDTHQGFLKKTLQGLKKIINDMLYTRSQKRVETQVKTTISLYGKGNEIIS
jgi:hypothetical protein